VSTATRELPKQSFLGRIAPAVGLFLLAPLVAEFLLGNIAIDALPYLVVLAPLYGGGALLIREVARRTGRGWPTIVLLGLAYAIFEEALVTQSLFNPGYAGADLLRITFVPALGIGIWWTLFVLTLHTVWSVSVPIAIVESFVPERGTTPWLGPVGLGITGILLLIGAALSFAGTFTTSRFIAPAGQLAVSVVAIVAVVVAAFRIPTAPRPPLSGEAPNPWLVGAVSLILTSVFMIATILIDQLSGWVVVVIYLLLYAAAIALIMPWSRRAGWGGIQRLALAGGALLTYAWHAFPQYPVLGTPGEIDRIGNAVFVLAAVALLAAAVGVQRRGSSIAA
jgi:hypothetical protein